LLPDISTVDCLLADNIGQHLVNPKTDLMLGDFFKALHGGNLTPEI
jgi:hypothetical protein